MMATNKAIPAAAPPIIAGTMLGPEPPPEATQTVAAVIASARANNRLTRTRPEEIRFFQKKATKGNPSDARRNGGRRGNC